MTDNKMTPEQFVMEWLPEYNKRWNAFIADWNLEWGYDPSPANQGLWLNKRFTEALEAFARHVWDQACGKQREECAQAICDEFGIIDDDSNEIARMERALDASRNAPAPEFKLTEKE